MYGPRLLARFLSTPGPPDRNGIPWQYNSRSDRHSKVGSWGVGLDLLATSSLLRTHVAAGKVVLGVNHEMRDFSTGRKKDLDLVFARPQDGGAPLKKKSFKGLAIDYGLDLLPEEQAALDSLPDVPVAAVGAVLIAMEAKACMTAHVKALPRLYDELNSSHQCVHGSSSQALAIGYVQINVADSFISSDLNSRHMAKGYPAEVNHHRQPSDAQRVLDKVAEIPRRSSSRSAGFDAIGVSLFNLRNDGSQVDLVESPPAPQPGEPFNYAGMIVRMANEYDATFRSI